MHKVLREPQKWSTLHQQSEEFAKLAEHAEAAGDHDRAMQFYIEAGDEKFYDLGATSPTRDETFGWTAVAMAGLYHKGERLDLAADAITYLMDEGNLPEFAYKRIVDMLYPTVDGW